MKTRVLGSGIELSTGLLIQMIKYVRSLGMDPEELLKSQSVDTALLTNPDARIDVESYLRVQEEAARRSGDPYFGLHMGEFAEPGTYSILGYLMMNCSTLEQAFLKSTRYFRIIGTLIQGRTQWGLGTIKVIYFTPPHAPVLSRHCFESTFSSMVKMTRTLTGQDISPQEVTFCWPAPDSLSEYERIFRCPVRFGASQNSMTLKLSLGKTPVLSPNAGLVDYFETYAREFLATLDAPLKTSALVTQHILNHLDDEALSIRQIARSMSLSVRTLQTRLKEEGQVFSGLLNETRRKLAQKYLRENQSVEDVTYLLGFSDPSAFRKAFKKWSGLTPREYRERAKVS